MSLKLQRKGKLFYLRDKGEEIPVTQDVYFMAVRDKIRMVKESGNHRHFNYSELIEVLEGILENDRILQRKCRKSGKADHEERMSNDN